MRAHLQAYCLGLLLGLQMGCSWAAVGSQLGVSLVH